MLLEFSLANFFSFREKTTFSMIASNRKGLEDHVVKFGNETAGRQKPTRILKNAIIYGPNASGKSNFINAISFVKFFVETSMQGQSKQLIPIDQYKFDNFSTQAPSYFETIFIHNKIKYRYGFEVTPEVIKSEWLFFSPRGREAKLFTRELDKYDIGLAYREAKGIETRARDNALFLSACDQFNVKIAKDIMEWFKKLSILKRGPDHFLSFRTAEMLENTNDIHKLMRFINTADTGIKSIYLDRKSVADLDLPQELKDFISSRASSLNEGETEKVMVRRLFSMHNKFNNENKLIGEEKLEFENESTGTQKLLQYAGPIIYAIENGSPIIIDEFDSSLHHLLATYILEYFQNKDLNVNCAQMIITTHNLSFLKLDKYRLDEIWLVDKNNIGVSNLFSLDEFNIRSDKLILKDYLNGIYSAIPRLDEHFKIVDK